MDAASNNSVEDIRGIKEKVNFLPTLAKYRVYIIDEVHMLSTGAFNALLKTLEEPPEHVKFILATTEPQKLPTTILSRCQRFDFKKISNEDMIKRLKVVCEESGIEITDSALNLIANLSEGAARDALSILERCLQGGETNIDEERIKDLVGIPKFTYVNNIIKSIISKDVQGALNAVQDILDEGKDLENFLWEMIKYTKDILLYKVSKKAGIYSEDEMKEISALSEKTSKEEIINIIYRLSELEGKMKAASQKTIIFETEVIKLCVKMEAPEMKVIREVGDKSNQAVRLDEKVTTSPSPQPIKVQMNSEESKIAQIAKPEKVEKAKIETAEPLAPGTGLSDWPNVVNKLKTQGKVMLYANLINTEAVEINDMTVSIRFPNGLNTFRKELLGKPENLSVLTKEVSILCGKTMQIKFEDASHEKTASKPSPRPTPKVQTVQEEPEDILEGLDIPINFVDEE